MKVIPVAEATDAVGELVEALAAGRLVCIPVRGAYRILADARSLDAITRLEQSKRRTHTRPALVIVSGLAAAKELVDGTEWALTKRLAKKFWPGSLTLVLPPSDKLAPKIKKALTRSTGAIGVRATANGLCAAIVKELGAPVLVSSANLEKKPGAGSASTVKARFQTTVDIWVDAGDLKSEPPSTLVSVTQEGWKMIREGAVSADAITTALG